MGILLPKPKGPAAKLKRAYRTQIRRVMLATEVYGRAPDVGVGSDVLRLITAAFTQLDRQLARAFERRLPAIEARSLVGAAAVGRAIQENVALIKLLPAESAADLARVIRENAGLHREALGKLIRERFEVQESRAEFWAVDQTLKNNAALTEQRAGRAGLTHYRWITSNDERVRDEHVALNGQIFAFNSPPPEGNPGEPPRCRCQAEVLFPDEF